MAAPSGQKADKLRPQASGFTSGFLWCVWQRKPARPAGRFSAASATSSPARSSPGKLPDRAADRPEPIWWSSTPLKSRSLFSPARWCVWRLSLISDQRSAAVWMVLILICYAEQNFLAKHITANTWIGLTDIETEGTWKWVDGNPLTAGYLSPDYPFWATVESRLCLL